MDSNESSEIMGETSQLYRWSSRDRLILVWGSNNNYRNYFELDYELKYPLSRQLFVYVDIRTVVPQSVSCRSYNSELDTE